MMASPPPVSDVHISAEVLPVTEVPEAKVTEQEVAVDTEAHAASLKGCFCSSCKFHMPLSIVVILTLDSKVLR
jgi:hypothetical protein